MKLKKLLTVLGCFALVLMCAFTFVGCGEVEATEEEIDEFFAAEGVELSFGDRSFHFEGYEKFFDDSIYGKGYVNYSGEIVNTEDDTIGKIYVEFSIEDATSGMTYYLKTTYYLKDWQLYNERTKKVTEIEDADMMTPRMFDIVEGFSQNVDWAVYDVLGLAGDDAKLTLQKKGDIENGNVTFIATAEKDNNKGYALVRFEDNHAVEVVSEIRDEISEFKIAIREYNGNVNLPSNLDEYEPSYGLLI